MNLFLTILAGLVISATAAFSTTNHLFSNLASKNVNNNVLDSPLQGNDKVDVGNDKRNVGNDRGVIGNDNVVIPAEAGIQTYDNNLDVLGESTTEQDSVTFNVDAIFNKALIIKDKITADNIVYGIKPGSGISIGAGQTPVITNTGVTSLAGKTGELKLEQGSGITIDGLKITNSGITSLTSGTGISVSGSTITNSDLGSSQYIFKTISVTGQTDIVAGSNTDTLTFTAGAGITLTTDSTNDKLTITSNDPSVAGGWTHSGTDIHLTTSTDSVGIGTTDPSYKLHVVGTEYVSDTLTAGGALSVTGTTTLTGSLLAHGNVTLGNATSDSLTFTGRIANGTSLLPDTDLGADLGSSSLRFNNLWVANINSNSSQAFSGQTTFSYAPTDTTISQASVLINPTTSAANGQLLGFAVAGYQKALIDEDGDIILGYSDATSAPATDNPLMIYGHSGTSVASIDTSGNLAMGPSLTTTGDWAVNTDGLFYESSNGYVGINTIAPTNQLTVLGDIASSVATGVEGLKLTDTTDVTKMAMKWTGTGLSMDIPGLATTNKLTNGTFETDITTGGWNQYTLNDQFTTDRAAGAVNGTSAEPTGGTRTVTDTNNKLSITDGQLSMAAGGTAPDKISYSAQTRVLGKTSMLDFTQLNYSYTLALSTLYFYGGTELAINTPTRIVVGSYSLSTKYTVAQVLRSTGAYYYIKGGTQYPNWTLVWIGTTETGTFIPQINLTSGSSLFTADNIRIPTSTWLPTPLAYDTFTRADGAISSSETTGPDSQTTPALAWTGGAISTNKNVITPTVGSELVTNGNMETGDPPSSWNSGGTGTILDGVADERTGGGGAQSLSITSGAADVGKASQQLTSSAGSWVLASAWARRVTTASPRLNILNSAGGTIYNGSGITSTNWSQIFASAYSSSSNVQIRLDNNSVTGEGRYDDVSVKPLTLSSLFSSVSTSDADVIADANVTLTAGTQAGLVLNLDSTSSPANFVIAYHDGTNVHLEKNVAGTYTSLINTAATYSAGATLRVIKDATKYRVYYNNALVGTEQTVSDAGIISNTKHGLFSTYSGNSFDNFTLWARGTGNEYVNLPDTDLTATKDTTIHYSGASSLKLVAGISDNGYTQSYTLPDTSNYTLSAFVYTDGSAVTSSDLSLENGDVNLATTYTSVGNGWYKISASFAGVASSRNYGVKVKAGRTVYVDNLSLFASSGGVNVLAVNNSTTGLGGLSVESTTTLNSGLASLQALIVKGFSGQTANLQEWQDSTGTVLSSISPTGAFNSSSLTSSGALTITPNAGSNLNVALSTTGDFKVNTNDLVVDTSTGRVGVGSSDPNSKLHVSSTTEQLRLGYDANNYWSSTVGSTGGLTMQGVGAGGALTLSPTAGQNLNVTLATTGDFVVNTNDLVVDTSVGFVGINTTAPTALLDLAGTANIDAFRLTNSGSKVLGLSYATNSTMFDQTSTDPTNKLLNSTFDSDLTSWSEVPSYTLNDQFTTDRAAGAVNGTSAEPTGGTRTVVDTGNYLSISGGKLVTSGGVNYWSPHLRYDSVSRSDGKVMVATSLNNNSPQVIGFRNSSSSGTGDNNFTGIRLDGNVWADTGASMRVVGDLVNGTTYQVATVLRSTGSYQFIKGGTFTNWTLIWTSSTGSTATLYPAITFSNGVYSTDNIRIPTSTWLPTPLAYDTFTRGDGAISSSETTGPDSQTTPSLAWTGGAISTNKNVITPTLGSEILTNEGFETFTGTIDDGNADTFTGWTKEDSTGKSEAVSDVHGGSVAVKMTGASTTRPVLYRAATPTTIGWVQATAWAKVDSGGSTKLAFTSTASDTSITTTSTSYTNLLITTRTTNTSTNNINLYQTGVAGKLAYWDDVSVKPLTLSSLFSTVSTSDADVIADANVTLTSGTQAGIVTNLDSTSTPANFLIAYHDGTNVKLDKNVGGTYTNLISTAATYSAGATLRVITYTSSGSLKVRVYYNNAMVGSEQTVSDAGIISNTKHGLFSTYSGNSFDNFTLWARGSGTTKFTDAPFEELTATRDTTTKYNNSTASVQLVAGGTDANYLQSVNVGDTSTYNLIAYAYTDGSAVTSADLSLYYDTAVLTTTYTAMGGTGWYKLTGSLTGVASAKDYGVRVKASKTVYVDEMHLQVGTATTQTMYVLNSNTGVTGLNVQGLINGTLNGVASYSKAGTISDSDFVTATDGLFGFDTTNHRLYFREGGTWSYIARTAGFQIPKEEVLGLSTGDYLMPYVESFMSDGAVHGLYQKFDLNKLLATQGAVTFVSDVTFLGKTVFNKDTAGTAIIATYSNQVDVKFTNTYDVSPIITMNLVIDSTDSAFIEEGQKAYLTNVSPTGFSIMLPILALKDYMYNWIAFPVDTPTESKSQSPIQQIINNITPTPIASDTPILTVTPLLPTASGSAGQAP